MRTVISTLLLLSLVFVSADLSAKDGPIGFAGAQWIWSAPAQGKALNALPDGVGYFRGKLVLPKKTKVKSAEVIITADNLFGLYVNGRTAGESEVSNNAWSSPKRFEISSLLVPGRNVIAVEAVNTVKGPAGLIAKVVVRSEEGEEFTLVSNATWNCSSRAEANWQAPSFVDAGWKAAYVVGDFGIKPWGQVKGGNAPAEAVGTPTGNVHRAAQALLARTDRVQTVKTQTKVPEDFEWPEAIVFVDEDCSLYRTAKNGTANDSLTVTVFNPGGSRAFPEHDLPGPMKVGRKLMVLSPAKPGVEPRLLLDAEGGALGSPSVTFDGKWILVSMAKGNDDFFHIYRLPAQGGKLEQLTDGPFHDIDPAQLPDGRIVFTSTRIGTFEEYHAPPSRSLFVMGGDGGGIEPLTHTIIFDNEPEVLADGRIVFIRSDNFFDRGKVETRLHAIRPDGTRGQNIASLDIGSEYGKRLRAFLCGSPAPMDDGRLAFLSGDGISVGSPGTRLQTQNIGIGAGDVAALPDARLLCTTDAKPAKAAAVAEGVAPGYRKIQVLDIDASPPTLTSIYHSPSTSLHSPVFLGARRRPPVLPGRAMAASDDVDATGFLFCQDARLTKNTTAGWEHVRAVRVLAAQGLTTRSSHSYIVHSGSDVKDLGTVPLAPDGSFHVEVPANTPVAFQAVDAEGRSELNEMSWIYVRPGETQSCVGCHESPNVAPPLGGQPALALETPPLKLLPYGESHRFRGNNAAVTGLMELQLDRFREVAGINRHGESVGANASGAQEVEALVANLRGDDSALQISSAQRLAIFRDPAAAEALAECLSGQSREVSVAAAMALASCGGRGSVGPLLEALRHGEPLVAQAAVVAIENLTGHGGEFNAFVSQEERERQADAWDDWFAGTTWAAIEGKLVKRMGDKDRGVVRRAAVALGHTGGEAGRVALRKYVAAHDQENPYPEWQKAGHRGDNARFNSLDETNPRCLQAVVRSLGYLGDHAAVPMLAKMISEHHQPETGNLFLAEAAVEALGRIATPKAERALIEAFGALGDFPRYTRWYGDHDALMACHTSPIHYLITEALDAMGSTNASEIVGALIRSVPIDPDRALLLSNDDCETLVGRVIRRSGMEAKVVETALSILGDSAAVVDDEMAEAIGTIHRCWAGDPGIENRAAQILSLVCRDGRYEARIRGALERYLSRPMTIDRVFAKGIPVVDELPVKNWVCFFLARSLGNLKDSGSVESLMGVLANELTEAAGGRPDPLGPGVHFLHNGLTPCYRAAAAWALGQIGDRRAVGVLLEVVSDFDNATDTRHAAAVALGAIGDPASVPAMRELAEGYQEVSTRRALLAACVRLEEGKLQP